MERDSAESLNWMFEVSPESMMNLVLWCLCLHFFSSTATKPSLYYSDLESARGSYLSIGGELEREYLKGRKPLLSFFSGPTSPMLQLYSLASGLIDNASWEEVRQVGRRTAVLWLCSKTDTDLSNIFLSFSVVLGVFP